MGQENIRLARAVIDAVEGRDLPMLLGLTDPEVDWHSAFALGGRYRGHDGLRQYIQDMNDAWDIVRLDVDDELAIGNVVVFVGHIQVRGKGSGVENRAEAGYVLRFREGRAISFRPFMDPEEALAAVGMAE